LSTAKGTFPVAKLFNQHLSDYPLVNTMQLSSGKMDWWNFAAKIAVSQSSPSKIQTPRFSAQTILKPTTCFVLDVGSSWQRTTAEASDGSA